jgi:peptidoglycan/LPS O-acetylase OafA/YrhL
VLGYPLLSLSLAIWVLLATTLPARWKLPGAGWLARITYSLYLSHKLALHAVATWLVQPWQMHGMAAFAAYAIGVLAVGAALHYAVERPFLRWRERIDARRSTPLPSAAAAP